jgi:hypothetical protein
LTLFGHEANATHLVSKYIGNAETCIRAKHAAAGIRYGNFDEPRVHRGIADAAVWLGHKTPQIQCTNRGQPLPSSKLGLVPRNALLATKFRIVGKPEVTAEEPGRMVNF